MVDTASKSIVLDTSYFIKLKPLELVEGNKYFTTDFIIKEIRDEKVKSNL
jgi:rRNA maturation endonuclease Nob1